MATELRKGSNSMSQKTTLFWAPTVWEARGPWLDRENWQARAAPSPWATLPILRISALGSLSQSSSLHGTKQLGRDRSVSHVLEALSVERKERGHPTPGWGWGVEGKSPLRGGRGKACAFGCCVFTAAHGVRCSSLWGWQRCEGCS